MDTVSDPQIVFDEQAVCHYCHAAKKAQNQHRIDQQNLPWIIDQIKKRGKGRPYDCVIGLSGGVDSSYAVHILAQWGLRIFAFTIDNGWNTPESDENVVRLVEGLKIPFYRQTINRERFRELQKAFIQSGVPNIEIPTDHIIVSTAWQVARREKVKTIVSGGNWQTESIMPATFGYSAVDLYHIQQIYKRFIGKKLTGLPTTNLAQYMWYRCVEKIQIVNILDYVDYNRERAQQVLTEQYGWKPYGAKHEESVFTKWFQDHYLSKVHGLDKRRPHLSSMIHSGQISREEAKKQLEFVPDPFEMQWGIDTVIPHKHIDYPNHERLRKLAWHIYRHF